MKDKLNVKLDGCLWLALVVGGFSLVSISFALWAIVETLEKFL